MADPAVIRIFDTTLRDGEQSPGAMMTTEEKLQVAEQLVRLKVDIIEAGFPAASPDDLITVKEIASHVRGPAVAALARASIMDIDAAWEGIRDAWRPVLHVSLPTSEIYLKHRLKLNQEQAIQRIKSMVKYARNLCPTVEFSAEDATRSDWNYLYRVCETAIKAGATTINLPDTVGYTTPDEYASMFTAIREHVPCIENLTLSAHCHNDLGMATANTLAAIQVGVRQVEVTINGIGERAGNTAVEEVVMALHTRSEKFGNLTTNIDTAEFTKASQLVSRLTGILVPPNKAVVGANVFSHEADMQRDSLLKHHLAYKSMTPQSVGWSETKLVLDKHSGRHGLDAHLRQQGFLLSASELKTAYRRFIELIDQKKHPTNEDLIYIAESVKETPVAV